MFVDNQDTAEAFNKQTLGFKVKHNVPVGEHRWLTFVSGQDLDGTELLLEPSSHPAVQPYKAALVADGLPAHSFKVKNLDETWKQLVQKGVVFATERMDAGPVRMVVFDDTCGNLIQLVEMVEPT